MFECCIQQFNKIFKTKRKNCTSSPMTETETILVSVFVDCLIWNSIEVMILGNLWFSFETFFLISFLRDISLAESVKSHRIWIHFQKILVSIRCSRWKEMKRKTLKCTYSRKNGKLVRVLLTIEALWKLFGYMHVILLRGDTFLPRTWRRIKIGA